jgi:hypothetical protein
MRNGIRLGRYWKATSHAWHKATVPVGRISKRAVSRSMTAYWAKRRATKANESGRHARSSACVSDHDAFDFIERDRVRRAIVQLGGFGEACAAICCACSRGPLRNTHDTTLSPRSGPPRPSRLSATRYPASPAARLRGSPNQDTPHRMPTACVPVPAARPQSSSCSHFVRPE